MTVTLIADGSDVLNNTNISVVSSIAAAAGDTIVVGITTGDARTVVSVGDGGINSYAQAASSHNRHSADLYYVLSSAADLPVGTTFSAVISGNENSKHISVWKINPGATALADHGSANGSSATPSVSTAGSVSAGFSVFGALSVRSATTITQPAGWTDDFHGNVNGNPTALASKVMAASGVATYNPTLSDSKDWDVVIAAFQGTPPPGAGPRYWVGGSASWDSTVGTKWATTSGGAGGAPVPTASDDVYFDAASGGVTCTVSGARNCKSLTCTGFTGTLAGAAGNSISVAGSVVLASGMTYTLALITMLASAAASLTTAGKSLVGLTIQNSAGITCTLQDALTCSGTLTLASGGLDANNKNISVANFSSAVSTTRALLLGTGTWTLTGTGAVWDVDGTGLTLTPSTSTIKINDASASAKTFNGGSKTYYNLWLTGAGTGSFTINGSNTFNDLTLDTPPHTLQFEGGSSITVGTASFSGTALAGNNTLRSTTASAWDINCVGGIAASHIALQNSHAHGGDFTVTSGFDGGGNLTWVFVRSASAAIYFDSAYQYNGSAISIVSGLNWLIGETLGVVADGVDVGDATVSPAGNLTLPGGITASLITVGKRYMSRAVLLRAPETGNRDGSALARLMAIKTVAVDMLESSGIEAGTLNRTRPVPPAWKQTADGDLYTGMYDVPIDDSHRNKGVMVVQSDRGYPAVVRAMQFGIESEP